MTRLLFDLKVKLVHVSFETSIAVELFAALLTDVLQVLVMDQLDVEHLKKQRSKIINNFII
jgi:hypothetical protein